MNWSSQMLGAARACPLLAALLALPGCGGVHLYREENAKLAQEAKKTYAEKVDLLSIVATERANLAKQRELQLEAVRQNQVLQRDLVFFNAARLDANDRLLVLQLPNTEEDCKQPLLLRYVARRLCELGAPTPEKLDALASAVGDQFRTRTRRELVLDGQSDLRELGWQDPPQCGAISTGKPSREIARDLLDEAMRLKKIPADGQEAARDVLENVVRNCQALNELASKVQRAPGLAAAVGDLARLEQQQTEAAHEAKEISDTLKVLGDRLRKLAEGDVKAGETRKSIAEAARKLREVIDTAGSAAKALGAQEALADLQLESATLLLQALEGETIPDEKLKGDGGADLRRAVLVAQTVPQLADDIRMISGLLNAPPKSSLLMAQRQALIDKENVAARKALLDKRVALAERRIAMIVEEAKLLRRATAYSISESECLALVAKERELAASNQRRISDDEIRIAERECRQSPETRLLLGYNYLSRSILAARAEQEAARWEEVYLLYEQNVAANEYALKSWSNLIGTPIVLLEGYHTGGIKAETLADLIMKAGGLGLLGIAVGKMD